VVKANLCMKAILLAMSLVIVFFVVLCTTILEVLFARLGFVMRRKGIGEAVPTQVEVYARQAQHDTAAVRNLQRAVQCCPRRRRRDPGHLQLLSGTLLLFRAIMRPSHECWRNSTVIANRSVARFSALVMRAWQCGIHHIPAV
jgi:hypothetical protein